MYRIVSFNINNISFKATSQFEWWLGLDFINLSLTLYNLSDLINSHTSRLSFPQSPCKRALYALFWCILNSFHVQKLCHLYSPASYCPHCVCNFTIIIWPGRFWNWNNALVYHVPFPCLFFLCFITRPVACLLRSSRIHRFTLVLFVLSWDSLYLQYDVSGDINMDFSAEVRVLDGALCCAVQLSSRDSVTIRIGTGLWQHRCLSFFTPQRAYME